MEKYLSRMHKTIDSISSMGAGVKKKRERERTRLGLIHYAYT